MESLKYIIKRIEWGREAKDFLAPLCENDRFVSIDDWEQQVKGDLMALFGVFYDKRCIAVFLVRIDESPKCNELVVVGAAGITPRGEKSIYSLVLPYVIDIAKKANCEFVRGHAERLGIVRLMEQAGYTQEEYICRVKV